MFRLFVALRPSRETREQLSGLMEGVANARWQDDDQLHLTLRFVGEVDRRVAEDVADALDRVDGPRPTLALHGVGSFGRRGHAHTLWAGLRPCPELLLLQRRIDRALVVAGVAPEPRAFAPHITLARLNRAAGPIEPFLARHLGLSGPPERPDAFLLYQSELTAAGANYSVVARYPLSDRA